jgi:hypothetical protein
MMANGLSVSLFRAIDSVLTFRAAGAKAAAQAIRVARMVNFMVVVVGN